MCIVWVVVGGGGGVLEYIILKVFLIFCPFHDGVDKTLGTTTIHYDLNNKQSKIITFLTMSRKTENV